MEDRQRKHITENLAELIEVTDFNTEVKAKLLANKIFSKINIEILDAESNRNGKTSASYKSYDILMGRTGAYITLLKILEESNQTGVANVLKTGLQYHVIPNEWIGFKDMEIVLQGEKFKAHELFSTEKLELAKAIFQSYILDWNIIDSFVTKPAAFELAKRTIPLEPPIYVPRYLSNRIEISESVFKEDCPDVFVFRRTIERWKLSEIAKPNWTDTSNYQLNQITARFIHLDEYEDWFELKKKAKVQIHLISYDNDQQKYILEDSSRTSEILSKVGSREQRAYLSEGEFVQQQLSEELKAPSVCICDKPGMGKTYLLAYIARAMSNQCNKTIVAFIQLSTFVAHFTESSTDPTTVQNKAILAVFEYVSRSLWHAELIRKLVKAELLQMKIFFDGFDEISSDQVKWMKDIFKSIKSELPNVQIYITSRPHMRHELEKSLSVIAYDIMPFNTENQVDYLVQFWSPKYPELDQKSLQNYALNCVKEINKTFSKNDKEMAGIPLLCWLIAEVYSKKVRFYVTTKAKNVDAPLRIAAMYQQFIQQRIKNITKNEPDIISIKLAHIFEALKLVFPNDGFHNDDMFEGVYHLPIASSGVLKAGILHLESSSKLEFIHRTFAEYFVAEYFCAKLQSTALSKSFFRNIFKLKDKTKGLLPSILTQLLFTIQPENKFVNGVIASFVDFNISQATISDEMKRTIASFCASISPKKIVSILDACCYHNLLNLLVLLKDALTEWNWIQKKWHKFTIEHCCTALTTCIMVSSSQIFHCCAQIFTEVLGLDQEKTYTHDDHGWTLLHIAAFHGNYEAFEYLMDKNSIELSAVLEKCIFSSYNNDVDKISGKENILHLLHNKDQTLIIENPNILATYGIHVKLIKTLVNLGANLTAVDSFGDNCMIQAAKNMSPFDFHELVNFLLIHCKAEYLFLPKWYTPFYNPLRKIIERIELLPETLELLLNIPGIDINMKNPFGENLLFNAVEGNKVGNTEQLVNLRLDYNERGYQNTSVLHQAALRGDGRTVRYLLSLNLDPNSQDDDEDTPLHYAAENQHYSFPVVKTLVENRADVQAKNNDGQTALHISVARNRPSCDVIKYLIGKGAEVNDCDNEGNTPLHLCKNVEVRDCLIEMGADTHAINKNSQTAAKMNPKLWYSYDSETDAT